MRLIKYIFSTLLFVFAVGIVIFNTLLYYQPEFSQHGSQKLNDDLLKQLAHLRSEIHNGAAHEMQNLFPEGFVFLNALYALSWIEVAEELQADEDLYTEAMKEVNWALNELESPEGTQVFDEDLELPYGIFYNGWHNYVLARSLNISQSEPSDTLRILNFKKKCDEIIQVLEKSNSPFLESYSGACWPADMTVAMASIAIGNKVFPGRYQQKIDRWIQDIENKTDDLGLIPHAVLAENGKVSEPARGSSQSLILNFLIEIDSAYAQEKFKIYKSNFLDNRLGLPGIREYPYGTLGSGDIDSGPVIWDIGGAASIVGQRVMAIYKEHAIAIGLRNSIETFGLGNIENDRKSYLFGMLTMADGFIAWSNSMEVNEPNSLETSTYWLLTIQLISFGLVTLSALGIYFMMVRGRQ